MRNVTILLFLIIPLLAGILFLQFFLSKRTSKYLGLILPLITFICSLVMIFSMTAYNGITGISNFVPILSIFLLGNIPTILFLGIYLGCREKRNAQSQLEKMKIQDLD